MDIVKICGIAICSLTIITFLKLQKSGVADVITYTVCLFLIGIGISYLIPIVSYFKELLSNNTLASYMQIMLKALGIAFAAQMASDLCKDAGHAAIAANVEWIGKAEIMIVSLPLIQELMAFASEILYA